VNEALIDQPSHLAPVGFIGLGAMGRNDDPS